jgi:dihydrofolate reductase / thymidylate synthase
MKFNIIVSVDSDNGIGKNNNIPWLSEYNDFAYFKKITSTCDSKSRQNVIIMGRKTWESLPKSPLPNRLNIIISSTLNKNDDRSDSNILIYNNLDKCLDELHNVYVEQINKIFIIGGQQLYKEAISHPSCDKLYITKIPNKYDCDCNFPIIDKNIFKLEKENSEDCLLYQIYEKHNQINIEEYQYIKLIKYILHNGIIKDDRTGIGTMSIWANQMRFNLSNNKFPLLTTKRVFMRGVIEELLWFIRGSTNSKELSDKNVKIWDANGSKEFLDKLGFVNRTEGDLGPVYGFQWRNWGAEYKDCNFNYKNSGIDQLNNLIEEIKTNPNSRRLILSAWNVTDISKMALPPCHVMCQFYVTNNKLSCQLYQRSGDVGLGVPFNIASYALLLKMIAHITNLESYEFVYTLGDAHIYLNHIEALKEQIVRIPKEFPILEIINSEKIKNIDDFTLDDFTITGYNPYKSIQMKMAV